MPKVRLERVGGATRSGLMGVRFKNLIIDLSCKFLGVVGRRKKERRFFELEGEERLVAAQRKKMDTCHRVHSQRLYTLCLRSCLALA